MANKARAKLVLELADRGMSQNEICRTRHMSKHTVREVLDAARGRGVDWERAKPMSDEEVWALLFPERAEAERAVAQPDWDHVHRELGRVGVTLKLLWQEYRDDAGPDAVTIGYSTFARGYAEYAQRKRVTSHLDHKPGQVMEVDWSGSTMRLADPETGEASKAYLFVAVLPYSQYTYVEATADMKERAWLECHVHAYEWFGGAAVRIVCDNLKTGVVKHPKDGEVVLNDAYEALGRHYGAAITPAPPRKPKGKPSVEGAVGKIATAVIARLRDETFASVRDLNQAIRGCLADYNAAPFQKRAGSRLRVFEDVERATLMPLPATPYEYATWVHGRKVALDFHVAFETNRYSVPYQLVGKTVDLRVTDTTVEAYLDGTRVATHPRLGPWSRYGYSTVEAHMPPELAKTRWDEGRMRRWAESVGPSASAVVDRIFSDVKVREQAYSPVMAVLNLTKDYGAARLEAACAYALERCERPRSRFIRSVLASGRDRRETDASNMPAPGDSGGYIRGAGYYAGGDR